MNTRALRHRPPSRSASTPSTQAPADAPASPQPALPKAAAARLARLGAANMPWLGQGKDAMLDGYDGPEISGPSEYSAESVKER